MFGAILEREKDLLAKTWWHLSEEEQILGADQGLVFYYSTENETI